MRRTLISAIALVLVGIVGYYLIVGAVSTL